MKKTAHSKIILYVISFILAAVGVYLVAVAYFAPAPVIIDDVIPPDYNTLTPEEQQALLDKFKNPETTPTTTEGSSGLSDQEADKFLSQTATGDSALTPEEKKKFLEQGQ